MLRVANKTTSARLDLLKAAWRVGTSRVQGPLSGIRALINFTNRVRSENTEDDKGPDRNQNTGTHSLSCVL